MRTHPAYLRRRGAAKWSSGKDTYERIKTPAIGSHLCDADCASHLTIGRVRLPGPLCLIPYFAHLGRVENSQLAESRDLARNEGPECAVNVNSEWTRSGYVHHLPLDIHTRPYKDKIPPKSEQFGFGGDVKSEILNHSVPKAPFPAGRQTQGLGNRGGSDSGWGKGWRHPHHEPPQRACPRGCSLPRTPFAGRGSGPRRARAGGCSARPPEGARASLRVPVPPRLPASRLLLGRRCVGRAVIRWSQLHEDRAPPPLPRRRKDTKKAGKCPQQPPRHHDSHGGLEVGRSRVPERRRLSFKTEVQGFPGGAVVESPPADAGDRGSRPGPGRSHTPRSGWARERWPLSLRVWSLCSATGEATAVRGPRTAKKKNLKCDLQTHPPGELRSKGAAEITRRGPHAHSALPPDGVTHVPWAPRPANRPLRPARSGGVTEPCTGCGPGWREAAGPAGRGRDESQAELGWAGRQAPQRLGAPRGWVPGNLSQAGEAGLYSVA
ncbi:collagen alpha-1(I) chain-like [Globicephala melas]|uniref:collagen alpha-1(I) chain-like n=1 Tax=Globicephala melas TaxID=9731 RepID=UPI00293D3682|nr:uncharacterized protein LOC132593877 [Globicephala melas]